LGERSGVGGICLAFWGVGFWEESGGLGIGELLAGGKGGGWVEVGYKKRMCEGI